MKKSVLFIFILSIIGFSSCAKKEASITVEVLNSLSIERTSEIVEVPIQELNNSGILLNETIVAENTETKELYVTQLNKNEEEQNTALLFQPNVNGNSSAKYILRNLKDGEIAPSDKITCYSRFVPERIDDYAWENDKIAFRMYGPKALQMTEEGIPGGIISNGIDCWLKKVDYPIIDKWYKKNAEGGSYHEDDGEGLDNYHVGNSRGAGGTCIYDAASNVFYSSKNYTKWNKIEDGALRASFELDFEPWNAGDYIITETKHISIDKGNNFTKIEIDIEGVSEISVGITLHEKDGISTINNENAWVSYWQPHADSELGNAIVVSPEYYVAATEHKSDKPDESHLILTLKVIDGKIVYYTGFAWKKSEQYPTKELWENYVNNFALNIQAPLTYKIE